MSRYLKILCATIALSNLFSSVDSAMACPMCSVANENDLSEEAKVRPESLHVQHSLHDRDARDHLHWLWCLAVPVDKEA